MEIFDFVNKYNGKKVDFDGAYGFQCVDLFRQYCADNGLPHTGSCSSTGGAIDLWNDYDKMLEKVYFQKVRTPRAGDVVIFGATPNNRFGHVAIVLGILGSGLIVFEQDGIKQDGAKINIRPRNKILGYLRIK